MRASPTTRGRQPPLALGESTLKGRGRYSLALNRLSGRVLRHQDDRPTIDGLSEVEDVLALVALFSKIIFRALLKA